jgi:hypothetical protein
MKIAKIITSFHACSKFLHIHLRDFASLPRDNFLEPIHFAVEALACLQVRRLAQAPLQQFTLWPGVARRYCS